MKAVILAGGKGERLKKSLRSDFPESPVFEPKPLVQIDGVALIQRVIEHIAVSGAITEFVICCGYRYSDIKQYFDSHNDGFKSRGVSIQVIDTGEDTEKAGRLLVARERGYIGQEPFLLANSDDLHDCDIKSLIETHNSHNSELTIVGCPVRSDFGVLVVDGDRVTGLEEKKTNLVNTGIMVLSPTVLDEIRDPFMNLECDVYNAMAKSGRSVFPYVHKGIWLSVNDSGEWLRARASIRNRELVMSTLEGISYPKERR